MYAQRALIAFAVFTIGILASLPALPQVPTTEQKITCNFTFFQVKQNGAQPTTASGINDSDVIVGGWFMPSTDFGAFRRAASGKIITSQRSGYVDTSFSGINNAGSIVGMSDQGEVFTSTGFLLKNGKYSKVNYPGAVSTVASGINNNGVIVGTYWDQNYFTHGFLLKNGKYTSVTYRSSNFTGLSSINDSGVIVGTFIDNGKPLPHIHGFIYSNGKFRRVDFNSRKDLYDTTLTSINNHGTIAGWYQQTDNSTGTAFEYNGGKFAVIEVPQSTNTGAEGISNKGEITGLAVRNGQQQGFLGKSCQ
jgi:probable HAF family extracellular repeat protein